MRRDRNVQETLSLSMSSCWIILVLGVLLCGTVTLCSQITTAMLNASTDENVTEPVSQESTKPTQEKIVELASTVTATDKTLEANREEKSETVTAKIIEPRVNLRASPSTNADILGKANEGEVINLIGQNADGKWYQTKIQDKTYWIFGATLQVTEGDPKTLPVINP